MSRTVDVTVRAIASGGAGVADLPDGRVVFVQRTAPGDVARVRIGKSRPRWAEASVERMIEASPERVEPLCAVYDSCGGCRLQHLPAEAQLTWKGRWVSDALSRIGGIADVVPPEVVPSPQAFGYRSRVTFTMRRLKGGYVVAGYHALGRPAHVIDVEACPLAEAPIGEVWSALRNGWGDGAERLPDGGRLRLTLRNAQGGIELLVEGGAPGWNAAPLLEAVPGITAAWHRPGASEEADGQPLLVAGETTAGGGVSFEQVNRAAAELLRAHVLRRIEEAHPEAGHAVDAYCGVGVYGRELAARGWTALGLESDPVAVEEAQRGAPDAFTVEAGLVSALLPNALPADLLVVNPPRQGLESGVVEAILADPPRLLIYVSCDPGTLARDLKGLAVSYTLADIAAFDLFPQTAHVESVAVLSRIEGERS